VSVGIYENLRKHVVMQMDTAATGNGGSGECSAAGLLTFRNTDQKAPVAAPEPSGWAIGRCGSLFAGKPLAAWFCRSLVCLS
jgi:hypothetical protein